MLEAPAYWHQTPGPCCPIVVACGPETLDVAIETTERIERHLNSIGLLVASAPMLLHADWEASCSPVSSDRLHAEHRVIEDIKALSRQCRIVALSNERADQLSWLGSISGSRVFPFGREGSKSDHEFSDRIWAAIQFFVDGDRSPSAALNSLWIGA